MKILTNLRRHWLMILLMGLYAAFVASGVSLLNLSDIQEFSDTADYHSVALQEPWTNPDYWAGQRTLTTPFIWDKIGQPAPWRNITDTYQGVPPFYTSFSLISWGLLALAVALTIRATWLKIIGFVLVLCIALTTHVFFWNWVLLSESPYISFGVLMIAGALLLIRLLKTTPHLTTLQQLGLLLVSSGIIFFWSFTRDTNAYIGLSTAGILVLWLLWKAWRRQPVVAKPLLIGLTVVLIGVAMFQMKTAEIGHRWQYPFVNVLGQRILPNDAYRAFFSEHGMPTNEATLRFSGGWANSFDHDWSGFNDWMNAEARGVYARFLLSDLGYTFGEPWEDWRDLVDGDWTEYARHTDEISPSQIELTKWVWPHGDGLTALAWVAGVLVLVAAVRKKFTTALWLGIVLLLLVLPGAFITWHGDAREVVRHSGGNGLTLKLGLLLTVLFALDALVARRHASKA